MYVYGSDGNYPMSDTEAKKIYDNKLLEIKELEKILEVVKINQKS